MNPNSIAADIVRRDREERLNMDHNRTLIGLLAAACSGGIFVAVIWIIREWAF